LLVSPCIFVLTGAFVLYSLGRPFVSPPCTKGDAHRRSDSKTCEQVFTRAPSYGSGRAPSFGSPRQVPSSVGYGGHPGGQDAGSTFSSLSSYGRTPHLGGARTPWTLIPIIGVVLRDSPWTSTQPVGVVLLPFTRPGCLIGLSHSFLGLGGSFCFAAAPGRDSSWPHPPPRRPLHSPVDQDVG
jgi:hypothetical protein